MTDAMSFATIICTYASGRWDVLRRSIESVQRQTFATDELIVSVDHNPALAGRLRDEIPSLQVVENDGPQGLSGARNSGISAASSDVIAFLDDDATAERDWLERLATGYRDPRVVAVGGSIIPDWAAGRPSWFPEEFDWVVGCTYRGMPKTSSPVRNLIGANMSFRREIFDAVGGFLSGIGRVGTLPAGCEETEFCIRVRQHFPDRMILYEPRARISHLVPAERGTWGYYMRRCFAEGRSKTIVARHVGASDGLSSERQYTLRTLPVGMACGLLDTVRGTDRHGAMRAAAIASGLFTTTIGFASSQASVKWNDRFRDRSTRTELGAEPIGDTAHERLEYVQGDVHV